MPVGTLNSQRSSSTDKPLKSQLRRPLPHPVKTLYQRRLPTIIGLRGYLLLEQLISMNRQVEVEQASESKLHECPEDGLDIQPMIIS